jgi:hypothetical protein
MKTTIYSLNIYESSLNIGHGFLTTIDELYIPKLNISINRHNGKLNIFRPDTLRYDYKITGAVCRGNTVLSKRVCLLISRYLKTSNILEKQITQVSINQMKQGCKKKSKKNE